MTEPSERRPFRITLQSKLLAVMLLCVVVPILSMGLYLLRLNDRTLREKVGETVSNHLLLKETAFTGWLHDRLRESSRWSASFVVYEGLEALTRGDTKAGSDLDAYLESLMGHYRVYESLFIADPRGQVLAATREEQVDDWIRDLLAAQAQSGDAPILTPLRQSIFLGRPTQVLLQPVFSPRPERRGQVLGYFAQRLDVRELETVLGGDDDALAPPLWLLDGERRVLVRAGKVVTAPGTEAFPVDFGADPPPGVIEGDIEGTSSVVAVRRISATMPGYVVAVVPTDQAFRAMHDSRRRLIVNAIGALLLILGLSYVAARSILKPITLLGVGARRVADGDLDVYLPVQGRDEIADLTRAFNDMAARIREGRAKLEAAHDELARTNAGLMDANKALETLAITDGLTSLFNHRHFQDVLEKEMRRGDEEGRPLSLLLFDIDHFKQFNDRYGHQEGDAALRRVAAQITKGIRQTDKAFRYGGEELAVLLPSCPKVRAAEVADKLRLAVRNNAQRPGPFADRLTVSVGVATFPEDSRLPSGLVDGADAALYAAKAEGRDRVVVAGAEATPRSSRDGAGAGAPDKETSAG